MSTITNMVFSLGKELIQNIHKFIWLFGCFITTPIFSQQPLNLEDCIRIALNNNLQHLNDRQTLSSSHLDVENAMAPFSFGMNANLTTPTFSEIRDTQESVALATRVRDESTNFRYSGAIQMNQRLPHLGSLSITTNAERRDFSSNRRADFLDFSGDVRIDYSHNILNRPSEEISLQRARYNLSSAELSFQQQTLALEGRVIDDFFILVQRIRELEIQNERLNLTKSNLELAQRKYEVGLIAEVETLRLQVEVLQAESNFALAETAIESQRDLLRQTLGYEAQAPLEISTSVKHMLRQIDQEKAIFIGLKNRTDMRQTEITEKLRIVNLEQAKKQNGINATLNANYSLRGRGDDIGDISSTLERNQWGVGIQVTMPLIDNGARRSSIKKAEIQLKQSRLIKRREQQQVILQIRNAVRNVEEAERQITILEAGLEVAKRTYEVEQSRFELGLAKSQDLLDAQSQLTRAKIDALNAKINYQRNLKDLRLATMAEISELEQN